MAQARVYRTEAVVLKGMDLGEADRILTLFTPFNGKLRVVGKGVRKPGSRSGGHLDLLTHAQLLIARARNLDIVTQAETIDPFLALRDDLWRTTLGYHVAELVDRLTEEDHEDRAIFLALVDVLGHIAHDEHPDVAVRLFEVRILEALGYRPQLESCIRCQATLERANCFFNAAMGGVLCPACGPLVGTARPISANAFALLRVLQRGDAATIGRVRHNQKLWDEVEAIESMQLAVVLERDLKSTAFLNRVRGMATDAPRL